jgi:hypothetical protein
MSEAACLSLEKKKWKILVSKKLVKKKSLS